MKRLLLLRHAKAVPSATIDHERALSTRGVADTALTGRAIAVNDWRPEAAIVSDARRTRQTYEGLGLGPATALRLDGRIYEGSADAIIASIGETGDEVQTLLVVGHNPSIGLVARRLTARGDAGDLARLNGSFPTACLAVLRFDASSWAVAEGGGTLDALLWADLSGS